MAMGAYQAIEEAGKKIPDDISVVGFDGLEISEYLVPSLTTVYQPSFDIGYYAAKFWWKLLQIQQGKFQIKFLMRRLLLEKHKTDLKTA